MTIGQGQAKNPSADDTLANATTAWAWVLKSTATAPIMVLLTANAAANAANFEET
jgi:hypothetical protein